jgi:zinc transporter ZupT
MSIPRKLSILVVFGVPAIIGGGIMYWLFGGNYHPVIIYEVLLALLAGSLVSG